MQMVCRVYPVMMYLRRIDKHPNGECPWCCNSERETLCHFQSECPQFELNHTAAHHAIARATVAALKDMRLPGWKFFYEIAFADLPFQFKWANAAKAEQEHKRWPDGVAWNEVDSTVIFLEFTRAMDNPENMTAAWERKGR